MVERIVMRRILLLGAFLSAAFSTPAVMYLGDGCGCCGEHAKYLRQNGFEVSQKKDNFRAHRDGFGVPNELVSCHSTLIEGYVVEGHVPIEAIRWLLDQKPNVVGVAVPEMPIGSPGMEQGGETEDYYVYVIKKMAKKSRLRFTTAGKSSKNIKISKERR